MPACAATNRRSGASPRLTPCTDVPLVFNVNHGSTRRPWRAGAMPNSSAAEADTTIANASTFGFRRTLDLIRFGGHLPKGGYDVPNGGNEKPTATSAVHG